MSNQQIIQDTIPWVEKYRPSNFNDIVLDISNQNILNNILETGYFPNLLLYGPPGTGKTTTIINLINEYQKRYYKKNIGLENKSDTTDISGAHRLIIHLNASDDRGIDIIRNQINNFVNSQGMFNLGMKFVILDEIDYMTKNAQHAFRYLLTNSIENVRFCLMCNYISKIDEGLQNYFLKLHFNQLPTENICQFLKNIMQKENIHISNEMIYSIQMFYKSDIRSMINFIQSNLELIQEIPLYVSSTIETQKPAKIDATKIVKKQMKKKLFTTNNHLFSIINNSVWEDLLDKIKMDNKDNDKKNDKKFDINKYIQTIYSLTLQYNTDIKSLLILFLYFIIRHKNPDAKFLNIIQNILHNDNINIDVFINYILITIINFL